MVRSLAAQRCASTLLIKEALVMANLDWSACPAVESVADRRSGA